MCYTDTKNHIEVAEISVLMQVRRYFKEQTTFSTDAQILGHQRYERVYILRVIIRLLLQKKD